MINLRIRTNYPGIDALVHRMEHLNTVMIRCKASGAKVQIQGEIISEKFDQFIISFEGVDMTGVVMTECDFSYVNLRNASLTGTRIRKCNFSGANMTGTNLRDATLFGSVLNHTNLRSADLTDTKFVKTSLMGANLSQAVGLLDPTKWMNENFKRKQDGYIVYKLVGITPFSSEFLRVWGRPKVGKVLAENVCQDRSITCGCGVNFGTKKWCIDNYYGSTELTTLWECLLKWEDLATLVVPYNTDGKARVGKLTLLRKIMGGSDDNFNAHN